MATNVRKSTYFWNTAGSLLSSFQSVIMLMVLTRTCGLEDAGIFTLAFANASLFLNIARFGIRNYQASDVQPRFGFRAYCLSRVITCTAMLIAGGAHLAWSSAANDYSVKKSLVIAIMLVLKMVDAIIDMFDGSYQQEGRLDLAGKQIVAHVAAMIALFSVVAIVTKDLVLATLGGFVGSVSVFVVTSAYFSRAYHLPKAHKEAPEQSPLPLLRECLPIFLATFLLFYVGNAPKYAIDTVLDDVAQAQYGFIAMPVFVVGLLAQFIYMPLVEPWSRIWNEGDKQDFARGFARQVAVIFGITAVCVAGAALLGVPVLSALYNTDLSPYPLDLCLLVAGGGFLALATLFTTGITIIRQQGGLVWGYAVVAAAAFVLSKPLVASMGIRGASLTYVGCMAVLSIWFGLLFASHLNKGK